MKRLWTILPLMLVACATAVSDASPPNVVITETGEELVAPRAIHRVPPNYPGDLRRQGVEGSVTLSAEIGVNGVPRNVEVVRSSHPALNQPAVDALRRWRFKPGTKDGEPVPVTFEVTIDFSLNR